MAYMRMIAPGRFNAAAFYEAMDSQRRSRGLSWAKLTSLWVLFALAFSGKAQQTNPGTVVGTSTGDTKLLMGSPTATGNGNIANAIHACPGSTGCTVIVDPAYPGNEILPAQNSQTQIFDYRFGQTTHSSKDWNFLTSGGAAYQTFCNHANYSPDLMPPANKGFIDGYYLPNCFGGSASFTEPGWSQGAYWYVGSLSSYRVSCYISGICNGNELTFDHPSIGDDNPYRVYLNYTSGAIAPSDEGVCGNCTTLTEYVDVPAGTVKSAAPSSSNGGSVLTMKTALTHLDNLGSGRPVIDVSQGMISGTYNSVGKVGNAVLARVSNFSTTASGRSGASTIDVKELSSLMAVGSAVSGTGIGAGAAIAKTWKGTSTTIPLTVVNSGTVSGNVSIAPNFPISVCGTLSGNTTKATGASGASTIHVASVVSYMRPGMYLSGTGIGTGALIANTWKGVSTTIPLTVANSDTVTGKITFGPTPVQQINVKTNQTLIITGLSSPARIGDFVALGGVSGSGHYEVSKVTDAGALTAGTQSVVIPLTYDYGTGTNVCFGGYADGRLIDQPLFSAYVGVKYLQKVLGSPASNELIVGDLFASNGFTSDAFVPGQSFVMYQGAIAVDLQDSTKSNAVDGFQITVDPSSETWTGHSIQNDNNSSSNVVAGEFFNNNKNPYGSNTGIATTQASATRFPGYMFGGGLPGPSGALVAHGGQLNSPYFLHAAGGPASTAMLLDYAPEGMFNSMGSIVEVGPFAPGFRNSRIYNLLRDDTTGAYLRFNTAGSGSLAANVPITASALAATGLGASASPLCTSAGGLITNSGCSGGASTALSATVAVGELSTGKCSSHTVTMTGLANTMVITSSGQSDPGANVNPVAYFVSRNTAGFRVCNNSGTSSAATTWNLHAQ